MRTVPPVILALAAAFLSSACDIQQPTQPAGSEASFSISDALNNGGNDHFFWLPPMVANPGPSATGKFDGSRSPTVEICLLDGGVCAAGQPPVAEFTMNTGPGSETIRLGADHYQVNWHTDLSDLDLSASYRISVFVRAWNEAPPALLGFADVQPVATGAGFKDVNTDEYIALVDGRTLPIKFRIDLNDPEIVFASNRNPEGWIDLYLIQPDASGVTRLTNDPNVDLSPQWSPDGTKILWARGEEIWVMDLVTGDMKPLTPGGVIHADPSWSPDGMRIVLGTHRCPLPGCVDPAQGRPDIEFALVFQPGGGKLTFTPSHMDEDPEYSPDGSKIVFERKCEPYPPDANPCGGEDDDEIWVMDPDGQNQMALIRMPGEDEWAGNPAFSPSGQQIAFSAGRQEDDDNDNYWDIYLANADGSAVTKLLTSAGYDDTDPSWSPDGSQVLFTRRPVGAAFDFEVWIMSRDGSNARVLITSTGVDALARWRR